MRGKAVIVACGIVLGLAAAAPAAAHPGHTSCAAFGAESAALGQAHELAPLIRSVVAGDPTAIGDVVAFEHGLYCEPK